MSFFPEETRRLGECRAVIMFDRVFPLPDGVRTVLMLGGTAYPFARSAVMADGWDELVTPSHFVAEHVRCWLQGAANTDRANAVHVIPNPVNATGLLLPDKPPSRPPTPLDRRRHLLFPHRADEGKGMEASLRVLSKVNASVPTDLTIVVDSSPTAQPGFYGRVKSLAAEVGTADLLNFEPWQPRHRMADLYKSADLTLCLGDRPEGFGLVCVESVLCGTPVLARNAGAQLGLLPPGHGCFAAPAIDDAAAQLAQHILLSTDVDEQTRKGGWYIRQNYSLGQFVKRIIAIAHL